MNLGTPDSPEINDVRKFLSVFLNDPFVITLPRFWRKLLVDIIIVPFRASKTAASYRQLWTKDGSPVLFYLEQVRKRLQDKLNDEADVWAAMNYGSPNVTEVMARMQAKGYRWLTVIPLFPQYASSTTGSIENKITKLIASWDNKPELTVVRQFYHHPLFLEAWYQRISAYHPENYDHIVFSFHGLPLSHLPENCRRYSGKQEICKCLLPECDAGLFAMSSGCYRAMCYDMAAKMSTRLKIKIGEYSVAFQSRMSNNWLRPFADQTLKRLAAKRQKILVVAPSFVADCLETNVELGIEYKKLFTNNGGRQYTLVESLNDQPEWIETLLVIYRQAQLIK